MKLIATFWFDNGVVVKEKMTFKKTRMHEVEQWVNVTTKYFEECRVKPEGHGATVTVGHTIVHIDNVIAMKLTVR